MIKGITAKEENIIKTILKKYPFEFYYYGSRVKGGYTKSSDLDILVKGGDYQTIEQINLEFNNSYIPYIVNLSRYEDMDKHFYALIEPTLVKIDD
jgi:predicted nucleotidyltransferase